MAFKKKKSALVIGEMMMTFYASYMVAHGHQNPIDAYNKKMRLCCTYKGQIL